MDLNDTLRRLEAAKGDPGALALATIDIVLEPHEPKLAGALEAAAVPHWFDEPLLRALLTDAVPDASDWFERLTGLTVAERFQAHGGWNVHEVTRLALRQRLFAREPERFCVLSRRAAAHLESADALYAIERVYHLLPCMPDSAADQLRDLWKQWKRSGDLASLQALAKALDELCATQMLKPRARAYALVALGSIREERIGLRHLEEMATQAVALMTSEDDARGLLDAYGFLGQVLCAEGRLGESIGAYQRARDQLERWAAHESNKLEVEDQRADLNVGLGRTLLARDQRRDALEEFEACVRTRQRLLDLEPQDPLRRRELAIAYADMGDALLATPREAESETYFSSALQTLHSPDNSAYGTDANDYDVGSLKGRLGDVLLSRGITDGALHQYESSAEIFERLTASDPDQLGWKSALAIAKIRVGSIHRQRGNLDAAEQQCTAARELYRTLAERDSVNPAWKQGLGDITGIFGHVRRLQGRWEEAAKEFVEAERLLRELSESDPDLASWKRSHLIIRNSLASLLQKGAEATANPDEKVQFLAQALRHFVAAHNASGELVDRDPDNTSRQSDRAWTARLMAGAMEVAADFADAGLEIGAPAAKLKESALNGYETGLTILLTLTETAPQNTEYRNDLATTAERKARLLEKMGNREDALAMYRAALATNETLTALDPTNKEWASTVSDVKEAIARLESVSDDAKGGLPDKVH
jgi:tetratricopeptide (TPR) repeat protein